MLACQKGHLSTVQLLCSNQCNVNLKKKVCCILLNISVLLGLYRMDGQHCTSPRLMATLPLLNILLITVLLISMNRPK